MNAVQARLAQALTTLPEGALWVGLSGGLDSTVLLHALAQLPAARARGLTALHIDHGSSALSPQWAALCHALAQRLGVDYRCQRVCVDHSTGLGLEAAWRSARHAAFRALLPAPGVLALAQHRDDQVETLLLRLLHGAGSEGLAAMRPLRPLHAGQPGRWLWRPLLELPRAELAHYARTHALEFVDDPANADPRHARSRVRHLLLPALRSVDADADARIAEAAMRLRQESDALDSAAHALLAQAREQGAAALACAPLRRAPSAVVRRALGLWLDALGLPRPPPGIWRQLHDALIDARQDASPELRWRGARLRRHGDRLYADPGVDLPLPAPTPWDGTAPLDWGELRLEFDPPLRQPRNFLVRPRRGGESIRQRGLLRSVKTLLHASGLPPWERARLPLLLDADHSLCAIGAQWPSDAFAAWLKAQGTRLCVTRLTPPD